MTQVFDVVGGHVVGFHNGVLPLYVGRDGYWTRDPKYATPFKAYKDARSVALWLEGTHG